MPSFLSRRPSFKAATAAGLGKKVNNRTTKRELVAATLCASTRSSSGEESECEVESSESAMRSIHSDSLTSFVGNLGPRVIIPHETIVLPDAVDILVSMSTASSLTANVPGSGAINKCSAKEDCSTRLDRRGESSGKARTEEVKEKTRAKAPIAKVTSKEGPRTSSLDENNTQTQTVTTDELTMRSCLLTDFECMDTSFDKSFNVNIFSRVMDEDLFPTTGLFEIEGILVESEEMTSHCQDYFAASEISPPHTQGKTCRHFNRQPDNWFDHACNKKEQQFDEHHDINASSSDMVCLRTVYETSKRSRSYHRQESDNSDDVLSIVTEIAPLDPEERPTSASLVTEKKSQDGGGSGDVTAAVLGAEATVRQAELELKRLRSEILLVEDEILDRTQGGVGGGGGSCCHDDRGIDDVSFDDDSTEASDDSSDDGILESFNTLTRYACS